MPKVYTCPTLYNDCKTIDISKLKGWGYLAPDIAKSGKIFWENRFGEKVVEIAINVSMVNENPYIELLYSYNGKPIRYRLPLIKKPSNLGKGDYFYFECPVTKKQCRKLYLIKGLFLHREAVKNGCMYWCQTWSKQSRNQIAVFRIVLEDDITAKPYFKQTYNGRPTKRYLKYLKDNEVYFEKYNQLIESDKKIRDLMNI